MQREAPLQGPGKEMGNTWEQATQGIRGKERVGRRQTVLTKRRGESPGAIVEQRRLSNTGILIKVGSPHNLPLDS